MILHKVSLCVDNNARIPRDPPTHRILVILLSLFPNVDDLTISPDLRRGEVPDPGLWGDDDDEIQRISPPRLRGSFKFLELPNRDHRVSTVIESSVPSPRRRFNPKLCPWTSLGNLGGRS